jgi:hypothetical protein
VRTAFSRSGFACAEAARASMARQVPCSSFRARHLWCSPLLPLRSSIPPAGTARAAHEGSGKATGAARGAAPQDDDGIDDGRRLKEEKVPHVRRRRRSRRNQGRRSAQKADLASVHTATWAVFPLQPPASRCHRPREGAAPNHEDLDPPRRTFYHDLTVIPRTLTPGTSTTAPQLPRSRRSGRFAASATCRA